MSGALVISLDFELHWGVRDHKHMDGAYRANLEGERTVTPRLLDLFEAYDVAATWATVGFMFANTAAELEQFRPALLPTYRDPRLNPYREKVGANEACDPLHYAPSLIRMIASCPRQEVASHTHSHFYCLEPGQDAEQFRSDLRSAAAIARQQGIELRSIVFPRNQVNSAYLPLLREVGVTCYRGTEENWLNRASSRGQESLLIRGSRLLDQYVAVSRGKLIAWEDVQDEYGLSNVRASMFLRPYAPHLAGLDSVRLHRIATLIRHAAVSGKIFHLWWHPHNFGTYMTENLAFLGSILKVFRECRDRYGMQSLTMFEAAVNVQSRPATYAGTRRNVLEASA